MTGGPARESPAGAVALLERSLGYTLGSLHLVTPAMMSNPTPCAAWNLERLLAHMNDSLEALYEAMSVGRIDLDGSGAGDVGPAEDPVSADPVAALRNTGCRLLGAWTAAPDPGAISVAGSPLATGVVAGAGAVEVAVHGWDVARGCGARRDIPTPLAEELLDLVPHVVTDADRPGRFAWRVAVAPGAAAGARLLALLGRYPG